MALSDLLRALENPAKTVEVAVDRWFAGQDGVRTPFDIQDQWFAGAFGGNELAHHAPETEDARDAQEGYYGRAASFAGDYPFLGWTGSIQRETANRHRFSVRDGGPNQAILSVEDPKVGTGPSDAIELYTSDVSIDGTLRPKIAKHNRGIVLWDVKGISEALMTTLTSYLLEELRRSG